MTTGDDVASPSRMKASLSGTFHVRELLHMGSSNKLRNGTAVAIADHLHSAART